MTEPSSTLPQTKRRLAAVVFTDVVGYSARMQADETATIARVGADLSLMRKMCSEHSGEFLNSMGDGLMLAFPSAVHAVSYALKVQAEFAARNSALPADVALEHRIGIHLGDVISLEDGNVAGDGVNIASRLESKAPPGGICISQMVYDTVKGKVSMQAVFIGPEKLKNIAEPISIWHVKAESAGSASAIKPANNTGKDAITTPIGKSRSPKAVIAFVASVAVVLAGSGWVWHISQGAKSATSTSAKDSSLAQRSALSIMVLPFTNGTGDPQQAYIADGLTASITADLARIRDAFVVGSATAFAYKDKPVTLQQVGKELDVRFVLHGNVQRSGTKIRINAQLADTSSNAQLWSESFDGDQRTCLRCKTRLLHVSPTPSDVKW